MIDDYICPKRNCCILDQGWNLFEVGIMKMGMENQKKVSAAATLIVIAMVLMATRFSVFLGLSSSNAARPTTIAADIPPERPIPGTVSRDLRGGLENDTAPLDPTLRTDLIRASEDRKYEGTGRNIFKVFVKPPKVESLVVPPAWPQPQQAHVPPPSPPIELKYYGYATPQGGIKRIFLAHDEDVFITQEGEIVDRRYKVVGISPTAVEILDVLSNHRQSLPLIQG